ncbi:MAG: glucosidase, partial [Spirochaetia bacterium]
YLLPTLWFRNTWGWGYEAGPLGETPTSPRMQGLSGSSPTYSGLKAQHPSEHTGSYYWYVQDAEALLFTENETNTEQLYGTPNSTPYVKDAFHRYLIDGDLEAVNPDQSGTKAAALFKLSIPAGESRTVFTRLTASPVAAGEDPFKHATPVFSTRKREADAFYTRMAGEELEQEDRRIQRQALAGLIWSKQLYYFDVEQWLKGDPGMPPPPADRRHGRNHQWRHMANFDIVSMPDAWEYPWYATWDLAFHAVAFALVDPEFAKRQLVLMTREWYMHPNGQLPAYEWTFEDVNPPVHAWAAWRGYQMEREVWGRGDQAFLEDVFHKLLLNFTWWVNRKDSEGRNIFEGGFLGLDNISVFDRSAELPTGGHLHQSDGTAWMAFFALTMLRIALELATHNPVYQNIATKFFEHFLRIAEAMTGERREGPGLWDEQDGFFYDMLHIHGGSTVPLRVRSLVGLLPLIAIDVIEPETLDALPVFTRRMDWFFKNKIYLRDDGHMACVWTPGTGRRRILSLVNRSRLDSVLGYLFDSEEFLSDYGVRSVSRFHKENPYVYHADGKSFEVSYQPGESESGMFGGNSNWRGPIWFPINLLLVEALENASAYYGDSVRVPSERNSGQDNVSQSLDTAAGDLATRLISIFRPDANGHRPVHGADERTRSHPNWKDYIPFHEYFHGDSGAGVGASHQTGWTALVAVLIQRYGSR